MSKENPKMNVTILVDRSGSMSGPTLSDHIGGMRSFVKDQQKQIGETLFNFIQFDSNEPFEVVFDGVNIDTVNPEDINLLPRGGTPLLDAVGRTINHIEEQELVDKSDQVVLMIITDGHENMSSEYKRADIKHLITEKNDDWSILFLGANLDNFADAASIGISAQNAVGVSNANVNQLYGELTSGKLRATRGSIAAGQSKEAVVECMSFNSNDRTYGDQSQNSYKTESKTGE